MTIKNEYFKEDDIMSIHSGKKNVEHSRELKGVNILVDFDKKNNIVGIEIYDFIEAIRESDKEIEEIFKKAPKTKSEGGKK